MSKPYSAWFWGIGFFSLSLLGCEAAEERAARRSSPGTDDTSTIAGDSESGSEGTGTYDSSTDDIVDGPTTCTPGEVWCHQGYVSTCLEDGRGWIHEIDCSAQGLLCAAGECSTVSKECAAAMNDRSYIGCEYWGVTLSNKSLNKDEYGASLPDDTFYYAVAIANDGEADATIAVTDGPGGDVANTYTVPAGQMTIIEDLPWKFALKNSRNEDGDFATRKVANAAYHITSNLPVTVYQFNPLHYQKKEIFKTYNSYTNDASLLLPAHVYRKEYVALTRPTMKLTTIDQEMGTPGFVAIVGPDDGPTRVKITSSAHTLMSDSLSIANFQSMQPGETREVEIGPFEVLQLLSDTPPNCPNQQTWDQISFCESPPQYDLSGTVIEVVSGPNPAVFAGHDCTFVPYNRYACDHLEQQMFPLETWGQRYLCAHNITQDPREPTVWRFLSGTDGNELTFSPTSVHSPITLNKGQYVEFESFADFEVEGTGRIAVAQFMVGQNYTSNEYPPKNGDPAMALGVPVEQYRTDYTFLAPNTYVHNYLTVIHKIGAYPTLDGLPITGQTVEINDEYARTNLEIDAGIHGIESPEPFAITVYGVGQYTSYMYPGGLDLRNVPVLVL